MILFDHDYDPTPGTPATIRHRATLCHEETSPSHVVAMLTAPARASRTQTLARKEDALPFIANRPVTTNTLISNRCQQPKSSTTAVSGSVSMEKITPAHPFLSGRIQSWKGLGDHRSAEPLCSSLDIQIPNTKFDRTCSIVPRIPVFLSALIVLIDVLVTLINNHRLLFIPNANVSLMASWKTCVSRLGVELLK